MTNFARSERLALAALFREVGPDAPTLCEGWTTQDLAVHLVIRDRYPAALPANASEKAHRVPMLAKRAEAREAELKVLSWDKLIGLVAAGPGLLSPAGWTPVDILTNTGEFYVHHEDVRRAGRGFTARNLPPELEGQLWTMCKVIAHSPIARGDGPVAVTAPGFGEFEVGKVDETSARIEGKPSELILYLFGRTEVADVTVTKGK